MARIRIVRAADGRQWMVRQKLEWVDPSTGEDFEHDMQGGRLAAIGIVSIMGLLWVALLAWWFTGSQGVVVPWWVWLLLLLIGAFFPGRWVLRRPRTLVAETPGGADGSAPERWVGWVRGTAAAREEMTQTIRSLETRATPASPDSPLQPVS
ncbi:hypothetical protein GCM10023200_56470 [Actinomycetospora chlora]|jgi:hypothetical protein|uniref:DUF983 domain-containing protein n=1 Tax=Actinomycetospora chlora TaxID=663608 RepID=A0ABP9CP15_9PSEU